MPISVTAASQAGGISRMVMGRPRSLLKFFLVLWVWKVDCSTAAVISLVVVLPTLPVMPTTLQLICSRQCLAMAPRASLASGTTIIGTSASCRSPSAAAAPCSIAMGM